MSITTVLSPETIFLIIWLLLGCAIFFGRNMFQWFVASLGILLLSFVGVSFFDGDLYGVFMVATVIVAIVGFLKTANRVMVKDE